MPYLESNIFFTSLFWFFIAAVFAVVEIEVEGKHGWAEKTSTWFRTKGLAATFYGFFMGGKPLTGYHLFMFFLPLLAFHAHFVMGVQWSFARELLVFAMYFAWLPTWDFLWFVLNPYYGVKKFKRENVWWHAKSHWLFNVTPLDYLFGWGVSLLFAFVTFLLTSSVEVFLGHLQFLIWFAAFTAVTIFLIAPGYKRWHTNMRKRDDRPTSGIFHSEK